MEEITLNIINLERLTPSQARATRRKTICPTTVKAGYKTQHSLKPHFQCPECDGPTFVTFPGSDGTIICGECDSLVSEIVDENATPYASPISENRYGGRQTPLSTPGSRSKCIAPVLDYSSAQMYSSLLFCSIGLKWNGEFNLAKLSVQDGGHSLAVNLLNLKTLEQKSGSISMTELIGKNMVPKTSKALDSLHEMWYRSNVLDICSSIFNDALVSPTMGDDTENISEIDELTAEITLLKAQLNAAKAHHNQQIEDLTKNAEDIKRSELENLRQQTEEEVEKLHREQVEEIHETYAQEIVAMQEQHDEVLLGVDKKNKDAIALIQQQYDVKLKDIKNIQTEELKSLERELLVVKEAHHSVIDQNEALLRNEDTLRHSFEEEKSVLRKTLVDEALLKSNQIANAADKKEAELKSNFDATVGALQSTIKQLQLQIVKCKGQEKVLAGSINEKLSALQAEFAVEKIVFATEQSVAHETALQMAKNKFEELKQQILSDAIEKIATKESQMKVAFAAEKASLLQSFEAEKKMQQERQAETSKKKIAFLQDQLDKMESLLTEAQETALTQSDDACKNLEKRLKELHQEEINKVTQSHAEELLKVHHGNENVAELLKQQKLELQQAHQVAMDQQKNRFESEMDIIMRTNEAETNKQLELMQDIEGKQLKISEMEALIEGFSATFEQLESKVKAAEIQQDQLQGQIVLKDNELAELKSTVETQILAKKALESSLENIKRSEASKLLKMQNEIAEMKTQLETSRSEMTLNMEKNQQNENGWKTKLRSAESKLVGLNKQILGCQAESRKLRKTLDEEKKSNENFQIKFKEHCMKQMDKAKQMYKGEKNKVSALLEELQKARGTIESKEFESLDMKKNIEAIQETLVDRNEEIKHLVTLDKNLKASLFEKGEKIKELKEKNLGLEAMVTDMLAQMESMQK